MPPRPKSQKNSEISKKAHTKWNDNIFILHPYFEEIIKPDPTDISKFICVICTSNSRNSKNPFVINERIRRTIF